MDINRILAELAIKIAEDSAEKRLLRKRIAELESESEEPQASE